MRTDDQKNVYKFDMSRTRRRETWDSKKRSSLWSESYQSKLKAERTSLLAAQRVKPSLASGLKHYRLSLGMSRIEFAEVFGISRRALYNYESGRRAVGGDLLEKIVKRGDVELTELFGLPSEPAQLDAQLSQARLSIDLFRACLAAYERADIQDVRAFVAIEVAKWPQSVPKTELNIRRVAERVMNELAEQHRQEAEFDLSNKPGH